jgi:hypothetical protein
MNAKQVQKLLTAACIEASIKYKDLINILCRDEEEYDSVEEVLKNNGYKIILDDICGFGDDDTRWVFALKDLDGNIVGYYSVTGYNSSYQIHILDYNLVEVKKVPRETYDWQPT